MTTTTQNLSPIPSALRTWLLEQLKMADKPRVDPVAEAKKRFIDDLETMDFLGNRMFIPVTKINEIRLGNNGIQFKQLVKEIIECPATKATARNNLFEYLSHGGRLLTEDFAFLFRGEAFQHTTQFLGSKTDDDLVSILGKIKLSNSHLNALAKALLHNRALAKIEEILREAYGTGESSLTDALDSSFTFGLVPHYIRRSLQTLLVEVYREGLPTNAKDAYNHLTSMYLAAEVDTDRANLATLLKEKFPHESLEFFQALAMNESPTHENIDIRIEAISEYAKMKAPNCTTTLWEIINDSKEPRVIFKALSELANSGNLTLDEILNKISGANNEDQSKTFLFTLLKLTSNSIDDLFRTIKSSTKDFFEKLLTQIPALKQKLVKLDSEYQLLEFEGGGAFEAKPDTTSDTIPSPMIERILNGLQIRTLIHSILQNQNSVERANAADLLEEAGTSRIQNFLQNETRYCKSNRDALEALKRALNAPSKT